MKNILIMSPCPPKFQKKLEQAAGDDCVFRYYQNTDETLAEASLQELICHANIIIGEPPLSQLKNAVNLEWIQMTWAGTDIYTAHPGFPEHVILTNASGAFGNIISEYVIGAILALYRQFPLYFAQQSKMEWLPQKKERSLEGKRVLILGTGDIGTHVAQKLKPFETYNVGIRRTKPLQDFKPEIQKNTKESYSQNADIYTNACFDEIHTVDALDYELEQADIVVGCLPNTPLTRGLLNKERLHRMKKDAMIVNVGRGSLIDLEALTEILVDNPHFMAALDVTFPEPLPADSPLWNLANVLLTPHIAGPSFGFEEKTVEKIYNICAENLSLYMTGEKLKHVVDLKQCY